MTITLRCRACSSDQTELVLELGMQPLANNLLREEDLAKPEPQFPLSVHVCRSCWLLQIKDLVPPVDLFSDYLYFSSFSDAMLRHAREAAERYARDYRLGPDSLVVEIASNDGYLLKNFVRAGIPCLGIEPAANIAKVAVAEGVDTLVEFFGEKTAAGVALTRKQADLILGNNVFAHAPDINDFVAGLAKLLKSDGRIVLEFPYAASFVDNVEFDTIYHEHVFYFSLTPLAPLFERHGLSVFRVEQLPIHGGSLRLFACHRGAHPIDATVAETLADEKARGLDSIRGFATFAERVEKIRVDLLALLTELKGAGKTVAAYGASAKGSTLLNYVKPAPETFAFIADRSTHKQGRLSPGLHVPIVGPGALVERMPDYTLLLTWNFATEILEQQREYTARGGKFIVPIPRPAIL